MSNDLLGLRQLPRDLHKIVPHRAPAPSPRCSPCPWREHRVERQEQLSQPWARQKSLPDQRFKRSDDLRPLVLQTGLADPGPLSLVTCASELIPTTRKSPSARAPSRYRTWPACKTSKQPLARTIVEPSCARELNAVNQRRRSTIRRCDPGSHSLFLCSVVTQALNATPNFPVPHRVTEAVPRFITTSPPA